MTDTQIKAARDRLKKLAKESPPPDQQKQGGLGIVKQLYHQITKARAAGWNWPKIQAEIGGEVVKWKPATLERYFQLVRKSAKPGKTASDSPVKTPRKKDVEPVPLGAAGKVGNGQPEKKRATYNADVVV